MNLRYCYDVNGQAQRFVYDLKGQLTAVLDDRNKPVEAYRYDPAGNILEKTLDGQTTRYVYDKANQLISSTVDGQETLYRYDAAGRLVQEGSKTYVYGYQDKILSVKENGKVAATFDYYLNGQLASVTRGSETETFYWDGLALVARGQTRYLNEPHAGGGAPVLASGKTLFNDLLGNTLGVQEGGNYTPVKMTAFGETKTKEAFFTGKPFIGELGYAFLLRNYRPNHGKWQTADPLGYPDGWNSFAYCNNSVWDSVDWLGGSIVKTDVVIPFSVIFVVDGVSKRKEINMLVRLTGVLNDDFENPQIDSVTSAGVITGGSFTPSVGLISYGGDNIFSSISVSLSSVTLSVGPNRLVHDGATSKTVERTVTCNCVLSITLTWQDEDGRQTRTVREEIAKNGVLSGTVTKE